MRPIDVKGPLVPPAPGPTVRLGQVQDQHRLPLAKVEPRRPLTDARVHQRDTFEHATVKIQARPEGAWPDATRLDRYPQRQPPTRVRGGSPRPEPTQLIQAREPSRDTPTSTPSRARRDGDVAPGSTLQRVADGVRRGVAEVASRVAGKMARAVDDMELSAQLRRVANPSSLRTAAAQGLGVIGDALRRSSAQWSRFAEGVQAAQRFAEGGGRLSLPRATEGASASSPVQESGAADWRRAAMAVAKSSEMMDCLSVADDEGARRAVMQLMPILQTILHSHEDVNKGDEEVHRIMRQAASAASALGAAREPADAAQAARALRSAGHQVRQLFAEQGGGAATVNTEQAATLRRLTDVVRAGDEAADAFKRGSNRSLAAIGAELASTLAQGGDRHAAQALALRERTHELLAADANGGAGAVTAAKRLHVAIRQAQAGAQWERERLLQSLGGARAA